MSTAQVVTENGHQVVRLPDECRLEGSEAFVKRVGRGLLLMPRDADRWAMLTASLEQFTDDYMQDRAQPNGQDRDISIE